MTSTCSMRYTFDLSVTVDENSLEGQEKALFSKYRRAGFDAAYPIVPIIEICIQRMLNDFRIRLSEITEDSLNNHIYFAQGYCRAGDFCGRDISYNIQRYLQHQGKPGDISGLNEKVFVLNQLLMDNCFSSQTHVTTQELIRFWNDGTVSEACQPSVDAAKKLYLDAIQIGIQSEGRCLKRHVITQIVPPSEEKSPTPT